MLGVIGRPHFHMLASNRRKGWRHKSTPAESVRSMPVLIIVECAMDMPRAHARRDNNGAAALEV
jgi:hypothetical protein